MISQGTVKNLHPFCLKRRPNQSIAIILLKYQKLYNDSVGKRSRDNFSALASGVKNYYSKFGEDRENILFSLLNRCRMDLISANNNLKKHKDIFHVIKFEDLIIKPREIMIEVCKKINIEFQESLLNPTVLGHPYFGNSHNKEKFSGISTKNLNRWKERIDQEEAKIIEYWLGEEMSKWGYELEFSREDCQKSFSLFYEQINSKYFYKDSFSK